MKLKIGPNT